MKHISGLLLILMLSMFQGRVLAQNFSEEVEFLGESDGSVTLMSTAVAEKKKDAQDCAVKSAFNALFHSGVEGLKNGTPMVAKKRSDYDFRFFKEERYLNYLRGEIKTPQTSKVGGRQRVSVTVCINLTTLKKDLEKNNLTLNPIWADAKKANPTAALNPTIVVVPMTTADEGYSFDAMRSKVERSNFHRFAINSVMDKFSAHGYKTRDFTAMSRNSRTNDILRSGTQTDDATMVAQQLPGDIVVYVDAVLLRDARGNSAVNLSLKAIEHQTAGDLASKVYKSSFYMTSDSSILINDAVGKIENEFFTRLSSTFEEMIANGREIVLDFSLGETVSDWDFDMESPVSGEYFKDSLEDWLREKACNQVYDIKTNTTKYINASVNVPLWNYERNRSYSLSNFSSDLRKFLKGQFGDDYKATVNSLGQKIDVRIE